MFELLPHKVLSPLNNAQHCTHLWNKIYTLFYSHYIAPIFTWFYKIISTFIDFVHLHYNQPSNNSDRIIMHVGEEFKLCEIESRIDNKITLISYIPHQALPYYRDDPIQIWKQCYHAVLVRLFKVFV